MQDKPRIYVAITTFHPVLGGSESQTLAQCQQLLKTGYQVEVLTFRFDHTWLARETIEGVPVRRIGGLFLGRRAHMPRLLQKLMFLFAMIVMSLILWKERKKYDVLQVCQLSQLVFPLAFVCLLARKPMTIVLISSRSRLRSNNPNISRTLQVGPLDPNLPWLKLGNNVQLGGIGDIAILKSAGNLVFYSTRFLLKRIKAILIVLSTAMLRELEEHDLRLPGTRIIPNGVDIVRFHPVSADLANDEQRLKTVVCVSRLDYPKGIDVLLQAWRLVQEQVPIARLLIVGDGPLQENLEMLADALHITQSVEFVGRQSDVPAQLHRATIAVLPSRTEGMPNALLEYMACGSTCIATRVSGSEDLIQHEVNGLLVDIEDYESMARAILSLLCDPDLARRYGQAARETVENRYVLDQITQTYVEVYYGLTGYKQQTKQEYVSV